MSRATRCSSKVCTSVGDSGVITRYFGEEAADQRSWARTVLIEVTILRALRVDRLPTRESPVTTTRPPLRQHPSPSPERQACHGSESVSACFTLHLTPTASSMAEVLRIVTLLVILLVILFRNCPSARPQHCGVRSVDTITPASAKSGSECDPTSIKQFHPGSRPSRSTVRPLLAFLDDPTVVVGGADSLELIQDTGERPKTTNGPSPRGRTNRNRNSTQSSARLRRPISTRTPGPMVADAVTLRM